MEKSDRLCELFQMQTVLNERFVVNTDIMNVNAVFAGCIQKNEVNFKRQESGCMKKEETDTKSI
jgi:hypothetical protein